MKDCQTISLDSVSHPAVHTPPACALPLLPLWGWGARRCPQPLPCGPLRQAGPTSCTSGRGALEEGVRNGVWRTSAAQSRACAAALWLISSALCPWESACPWRTRGLLPAGPSVPTACGLQSCSLRAQRVLFSLPKTSGPAALSVEQIHLVPFPDRVIIAVIRINLALRFFFPSCVTSVTERM